MSVVFMGLLVCMDTFLMLQYLLESISGSCERIQSISFRFAKLFIIVYS